MSEFLPSQFSPPTMSPCVYKPNQTLSSSETFKSSDNYQYTSDKKFQAREFAKRRDSAEFSRGTYQDRDYSVTSSSGNGVNGRDPLTAVKQDNYYSDHQPSEKKPRFSFDTGDNQDTSSEQFLPNIAESTKLRQRKVSTSYNESDTEENNFPPYESNFYYPKDKKSPTRQGPNLSQPYPRKPANSFQSFKNGKFCFFFSDC